MAEQNLIVMDIRANVMTVVTYASTIKERLTSNFSSIERIPRHVEAIATKLPQLVEVVKQAEAYAKEDDTHESRQEELLEPIEECDSLLRKLAKIVPKVSPSPNGALKSEQLLQALENDDRIKTIAGRIESHYRTLQSLLKKRPIKSKDDAPKIVEVVPNFKRIESEHRDQIRAVKKLNSSLIHWSGTTDERYDLDYDKDLLPEVQQQVDSHEGAMLGQGAYGYVRQIRLRPYDSSPIIVAKKSITISGDNLKKIKEEIIIGQKLEGCAHIATVLGAYKRIYPEVDMYNILIFPVADCDLERFLEHCQELDSELISTRDNAWQKLMRAAALDLTPEMKDRQRDPSLHQQRAIPNDLTKFIKRSMGCMVTALSWIHNEGIAHHDLKPANILLRNGMLYVTDFGLCKDRTGELKTHTELDPGGTRGFLPREIEEKVVQSPRRADVYSLGCILMHMVTVIYFVQPISACSDILRGDYRLRESLIDDYLHQRRSYYGRPGMEQDSDRLPEPLRDLILSMLKDNRYMRPPISDINNWLYAIGGKDHSYHGACCPRNKHPPSFTPQLESERWWGRLGDYFIEEYFEGQFEALQFRSAPITHIYNYSADDIELPPISYGRSSDLHLHNSVNIALSALPSGRAKEHGRFSEDGARFKDAWRMAVKRVADVVGQCQQPLQITRILRGQNIMAETSICRGSLHEGRKIIEKASCLAKLTNHHHIVRLLGASSKTCGFMEACYSLTSPVPDCTLQDFLNCCEAAWPSASQQRISNPIEPCRPRWLIGSIVEKVANIAIPSEEYNKGPFPPTLRTFLERTMGCLLQTIDWAHKRSVPHTNLHPNSLVLKNGRLYVKDFGQVDDPREPHLDCFMPPGVRAEHSPFQIDLYSIGCIMLYMTTIMYGVKSGLECKELLTRHQASPIKHRDEIREFLGCPPLIKKTGPQSLLSFNKISAPPPELSDIVCDILVQGNKAQPILPVIIDQLRRVMTYEGFPYFHDCCEISSMESPPIERPVSSVEAWQAISDQLPAKGADPFGAGIWGLGSNAQDLNPAFQTPMDGSLGLRARQNINALAVQESASSLSRWNVPDSDTDYFTTPELSQEGNKHKNNETDSSPKSVRGVTKTMEMLAAK